MVRFFCVLFVSFGIFAANTANAGALSSIFGKAFLEDDDWESQVTDAAGDGILNDGDVLLSVIQLNFGYNLGGVENGLLDGSVTDDGVPEATYTNETLSITGISLIEVDGDPLVTGGVIADYSFKGASAADWLAFTGLTVADNTGAILFENLPTSPDPRIDFSSIASAVGDVISGTEIARFSVVEWVARTVSLTDPTDPTSPDLTLDFVASLNTDDPNFAPHNLLGDPDLGTPFALSNLGPVGPVDLQLQGGLGTGAKGGFQLRTDTDLYVNIVPEPTSFAIFGVMGLAGLSVRRRRRA